MYAQHAQAPFSFHGADGGTVHQFGASAPASSSRTRRRGRRSTTATKTPAIGAVGEPGPLGLLDLPDTVIMKIAVTAGPVAASMLGASCRRLHVLTREDHVWLQFWALRLESKLESAAIEEAALYRERYRHKYPELAPLCTLAQWRGAPKPATDVRAAYVELHRTPPSKPLMPVNIPGGEVQMREITCSEGFTHRFHDEGEWECCGGTVAGDAWCRWPGCGRARCEDEPSRCRVVSRRLNWEVPPDSRFDVELHQCSFCRQKLCRDCAAGKLDQCSLCGRGACLDCQEWVQLGAIRQCASELTYYPEGGFSDFHVKDCAKRVCWRCAGQVKGHERGELTAVPFVSPSEFDSAPAEELLCIECCRGQARASARQTSRRVQDHQRRTEMTFMLDSAAVRAAGGRSGPCSTEGIDTDKYFRVMYDEADDTDEDCDEDDDYTEDDDYNEDDDYKAGKGCAEGEGREAGEEGEGGKNVDSKNVDSKNGLGAAEGEGGPKWLLGVWHVVDSDGHNGRLSLGLKSSRTGAQQVRRVRLALRVAARAAETSCAWRDHDGFPCPPPSLPFASPL